MKSISKLVFLFLIFLSACVSETDVSGYVKLMETKLPGNLNFQYPFNESVFPAEIQAPSVIWKDANSKSEQWILVIKSKHTKICYSEITDTPNWKFPLELWESLKQNYSDQEIEIVAAGINKSEKRKLQSGTSIAITISSDSVNAPIFFRAVPLPFKYATSHLDSIKYMFGSLSSTQKPRVLLNNLPVCGNCHSFSPDGKKMGMDVDAFGDKGSYLIADLDKEIEMTADKFITWNDFQKKSTMALLSQISPNGKYVISTLDDNEIFESRDQLEYSQLFFPIKGILCTYDIEKKKYKALKGADDTLYVQSNSQWSPDNKTIYFARSKAVQRKESGMTYGTGIFDANKFQAMRDSFLNGEKEFKFDLMKIPFNDGNGGTPEAIKGASKNNKSNYFAKISPNGQWLVFCQANNYMLLQPDSKMYIMPTDGSAEARLMNCNTSNMNSWHSWSPNGKWMVFSSKYFGAYTQLFLTHIDEKGNDSPPIWLESLSVNNRAANIPEFVNTEFNDFQKITDKFSDVADYNVRGTSKAQFGNFKLAIDDFNKAIQVNKKNAQAYANRGKAKDELGDLNGALQDLSKAIEIEPSNHDFYIHRGNTKLKLKDYKGTLADCATAINLKPNDAALYAHRAGVLEKLNQTNEALNDLTKAINLQPKQALYYLHKATIYKQQNKLAQAILEINKALNLEPQNIQYLSMRAEYFVNNNQIDRALEDLNKGIKINPEYYALYQQLAIISNQQNDFAKAINFYQKAIKLYSKDNKTTLAIMQNNCGIINGQQKQFDKALGNFSEAVALVPEFVDAYSNRAFAYYNMARYAEAMRDCEMALQIEPGFKKAMIIRDLIRKKL